MVVARHGVCELTRYGMPGEEHGICELALTFALSLLFTSGFPTAIFNGQPFFSYYRTRINIRVQEKELDYNLC
jgi:hypothetical protein